jgi:hypothetical protein
MAVNHNLWNQGGDGAQIVFVSLKPNAITVEQLMVGLRGLFV